ncbi:endonuclease domain-containing protein [Pseudarthrobacter sp. S9]|uniref:endonuclease domain-containing protein n=1 Tax=Pseudarthrobacter sp. S9 TaxID=3418421 RepID=UPI003CFE1D75
MATAKPLPEGLAAGSFTIGEARLDGLSPWRAKAKDIHVPSRGIRVPAGPEQSLLARARPYTPMGTADTVSFFSAAEIHAFKLPGGVAGVRLPLSARILHLTRNGSAAPRRKGVVGHRSALPPEDVLMLQGVPVTSIPRTLVDLAGTGALTREDIVVIADDLVCEHPRYQHRRIARLPLRDLLLYVEQKSRVAGLPLLRSALELVCLGVDSPPETRLRLLFGCSAIPRFEPNYVLMDSVGTPLWMDLGCPEYRLAVEYDGGHHLTPAQQQSDALRNERTASAGWRQLVINKLDVRNGDDWVLVRVRQALRAQGWPG